jgi:hypothetical protein
MTAAGNKARNRDCIILKQDKVAKKQRLSVVVGAKPR